MPASNLVVVFVEIHTIFSIRRCLLFPYYCVHVELIIGNFSQKKRQVQPKPAFLPILSIEFA